MPTYLMADLGTSLVELIYFTQVSKDLKWHQTMDTEIAFLLNNKSWSLVTYHPTMNLVGCK